MTALHELQSRLQKLQDVREILTSMKNLAYMETRKLGRRLAAQREATAVIETAAADFLGHYPELRPASGPLPPTAILIGSERGFCGNFNERLLAASDASECKHLVAAGHKLVARLEGDPRLAAAVDGPCIAEEVEAVMDALVKAMAGLGTATLVAFYHDPEGGVQRMPLLPPFSGLAGGPAASHPPLLNLEPAAVFVELVDQYLFAALQLALLASLLAENQQRVQHLEGAVQHLDEQVANLEHRRHQLRQEAIIEEIEVILLNATDPDQPPRLVKPAPNSEQVR
jgi:F-type H+-transporting ATPase subunit gamma